MLELESIGPPKLSDSKMGLHGFTNFGNHSGAYPPGSMQDGCKNGMNGRNHVSVENADERL